MSEAEQSRKALINKLGQTARETGFFYLINHDVDQELLDNVQRVARAFFALSQEEKLKVNADNGAGYSKTGRPAGPLAGLSPLIQIKKRRGKRSSVAKQQQILF